MPKMIKKKLHNTIKQVAVINENDLKIFRDINAQIQLNYSTTDLLENLKDVKSGKFNTVKTIKQILNYLVALCEREGIEATSSIMGMSKVKRNNEKGYREGLSTIFWSDNVSIKRREDIFPIPLNHGLAGRTFVDGLLRWANDFRKEKHFDKNLHKNWSKYYRSGFSSAIMVNGDSQAILNLDSPKINAFSKKHGYIIGIASNLIGLILQFDSFFDRARKSGRPILKTKLR